MSVPEAPGEDAGPVPRATAARLRRSAGDLATAATARMDAELPWFRRMPAETRAWVGLVASAGVTTFTEWFGRGETGEAVSEEVFGAAPREMARAVTLQQAVALVRVTVAVVEERVADLAAPGEEAVLREAVLRYSREVAFAAARVYARAAEQRGAWDARLEALLVDDLLRGDADPALPARAAAVGWGRPATVTAVVGTPAPGEPEQVLADVRAAARAAGLVALAGVHDGRLVVFAGAPDPDAAARALLDCFGAGPVVVGPAAADLTDARPSVRAALAGLRAVGAWPQAPRPVHADDLLPERLLAGDEEARRLLVEEVHRPLTQAAIPLLETVAAFEAAGRSLEAAARALYLHPNTVRYRLRKVAELVGHSPTDPRGAWVLQCALALGRLPGTADTDPRPL